MKLNRLEAHDRLEHFKKDQDVNIFQGAEDCLKRNPDALSMQEHFPYIYVFGHPRTADDGVTKRMIWQPRLTKPKPQPNSYLFRALSKTDILEIIWILPSTELWKQFQKGNIFANDIIEASIKTFVNHPDQLERPEPDDFSEDKIKKILESIQPKGKIIGA